MEAGFRVAGGDGRLSEALTVLEELARSAPDTRTLLTIGRILEEMGDYDKAAPMFRAVLAENPNHAAARFSLGFVLYKRGVDRWERGDRAKPTRELFEEAITELQRSTELRPDHGTAHLAKAMALRYLGRLPEAEAACREAVLVSPQIANCHLTLGEILIDCGRAMEAIPHLEEVGPPRPRASHGLSLCWRRAQNGREAVTHSAGVTSGEASFANPRAIAWPAGPWGRVESPVRVV